MKFLMINGKLQKDSNGKLITLPDSYENNKIVSLNGKVLTVGGKVIKTSVSGETTREEFGLFDENDNLIKSWSQLVEEGLVTVR